MRKKIAELDMPVGKLTKIKDILPSPAELTKEERMQKMMKRSILKGLKMPVSKCSDEVKW